MAGHDLISLMGLGTKCPSCGKRNPLERRFCASCGTYLHSSRTRDPSQTSFDWRWMFLGILIISVAALAALLGMTWSVGQQMVGWSAGKRLMVLLVSVASAFFVGGIVVGRMSAGVTLKEPAAAGAVACLIVFVSSKGAVRLAVGGTGRLFDLQITAIALMLPVCIGLAYVGGWVGEKWQGTI